MRGSFVVAGGICCLDINGENWHQTETISSSLYFEGDAPKITDENLGLGVAIIDLKKFKKKDEAAFTFLEKKSFVEMSLPYEHSFQTTTHTAISDGAKVLAYLVGDLTKPLECNQLQLTIKPHAALDAYLKTLETFKRFKVKSIKNKKEDLEVKLTAPSSGEYAQIDALSVLFKFKDDEGKELKLDYVFQVKKLGVGAAGVEARKEKAKYSQEISKKDWEYMGALNQDRLLEIIDDALTSWKGNLADL